MKILKYIITDSNKPILFSSNILDNEISTEANSSGFVIIYFDPELIKFQVKCFGKLKSRCAYSQNNDDEVLIEKYLNNRIFYQI